MKKTLLKISGTLLAIVAFFIVQSYIQQYYDIDPRIWFFVVFGICNISLVAILLIFHSEIKNTEKYFQTHSFSDFMLDTNKKMGQTTETIESMAKKIAPNPLYMGLSFVILMISFTGVMYKFFFYDDFMSRTTLFIIFLTLLACRVLCQIIETIGAEGKKRKTELIFTCMWVYIFLVNLVDFLA